MLTTKPKKQSTERHLGGLVGVVVPVPDELSEDLHQLDVQVVDLPDDLRRPVLVEGRQLLGKVDHGVRCRHRSSWSWWDVPVSQVSELDTTETAYGEYERHKQTQRPLLTPTNPGTSASAGPA